MSFELYARAREGATKRRQRANKSNDERGRRKKKQERERERERENERGKGEKEEIAFVSPLSRPPLPPASWQRRSRE